MYARRRPGAILQPLSGREQSPYLTPARAQDEERTDQELQARARLLEPCYPRLGGAKESGQLHLRDSPRLAPLAHLPDARDGSGSRPMDQRWFLD